MVSDRAHFSHGLPWVYGAHGMVHAFMFAFPVVLALVREEFGASWFQLGMIATASNMAFGAGAIPAGYFTDRLGSRRVLVLSLTASSLLVGLAGFSPNLWLLGGALVLVGAAGALYHPSALTLITVFRPNSGRAVGLHGVGGSLGMTLAPLVLGAAAGFVSWRGAFLVLAAIGLVYAVLAARLLPHPVVDREERNHSSGKSTEPGSGRVSLWALALVYVVIMAMGFLYNGFIAYLPAYMGERAPGVFTGVIGGGALSTVVLMFGMIGQYWGGTLAEGSKVHRSYLGITVASAVTVLLMGLTGGWLLLAAGSVFSVVLFANQPMGNTLVARFTSQVRRGLAYGVSFTLAFGVGSIAGGILGYVADWGGLHMVYVTLGITTVPAVIATGALALGVGLGRSRHNLEQGSEAT